MLKDVGIWKMDMSMSYTVNVFKHLVIIDPPFENFVNQSQQLKDQLK